MRNKSQRIKGRFIPLAALLVILPVVAVSQQVHTYSDRDSVRAGDLVRYTIVVELDAGSDSLQLPSGEDFESDDLDFIEEERHRVGSRRDSVIYTLQSFALGDTEISGQTIRYRDRDGETVELRSLTVPLYFKTVLADGDDEFRPLKPIFEFAASLWPWILLALLLAVTIWLIYRYIQRKEPEPEPVSAPVTRPFQNPLEKLEKELSGLSGLIGTPDHDKRTEFYVRLGDAIREYLKTVHRIDALEMTSAEILSEIRKRPTPRSFDHSVRELLNEADMVKFARFEPDREQMKTALDYGFEFLEEAASSDHDRIDEMREKHKSATPDGREYTSPHRNHNQTAEPS